MAHLSRKAHRQVAQLGLADWSASSSDSDGEDSELQSLLRKKDKMSHAHAGKSHVWEGGHDNEHRPVSSVMATLLSQHCSRSPRRQIRRAYARRIRCPLCPDPFVPRFIGGGTFLTSQTSGFVNVFFSQLHAWRAVLRFHGAVLLEIERGLLTWGDSFLYLESRSLYGHLKPIKPSASTSSSATVPVLFCRDYQRNTCSFQQDHYDLLRGERKLAPPHLCQQLGERGRKQALHPEGSKECPSSANSGAKN